MGRINTNVSALISQHRLSRSQKDLNTTLERLSSGLRINRGADDPAGLIASENLRSEIAGVTQAIDNSQRATNVIATAEGALNEVAALLVDMQKLVVQAANSGGMSADEIDANQLQIDSAVESITRIANTTTFAGLRLLDGSLDYVSSGIVASQVASLEIHNANFGTHNNIPVNVDVTQSARQASLYFSAASVTAAKTIEVKGPGGNAAINLVSGATACAILAAVNAESDVTGVKAIYINSANHASGVIFRTVEYGSGAYVSVKPLQGGAFDLYDSTAFTTKAQYIVGQDAQALINGHRSTGRGLELSLNSSALNLTLQLDQAMAKGKSTTFYITSGGALFQLGPSIDANQQVNVGIQSIAATNLGNKTVGYLSQITRDGDYSLVSHKAAQASDIVKEAIRQVSVLRGRLGAFERNTLSTNVNSLNVTMENLTSSQSSIRDADFAQETSNMTRNQILVQAGTSVLSMANSTPQSVLSLLGK